MDDDVKVTEAAPQAAEAEAVTASPAPQQENQQVGADAGVKAPDVQPEHTVPFAALREERMKRQELQRQLAELKARGTMQREYGQYSEDESFENVMAHPFVQNLLIQQAKRELVDYARDTLDKYPQLPDQVRKAILKNPRGFVQEATSDIENAKLDLSEYIEELVAGMASQPTLQQAKAFAVAATNAPQSESSSRPVDVAKILEKPADEITDDEMKVVDEYKKTRPRK